MREQVDAAIELLRPVIRGDGGDVTLRHVDEDEGIVVLEFEGGCGGCAGADLALVAGVGRILRDRVPGVTRVRPPEIGEVFDTPVDIRR